MKLFLTKCLPVNKRGELNYERNTSKIETSRRVRVSRVRYTADPEQRRVSARDSYIADLQSNRVSKRQRYEQSSDDIRACTKVSAEFSDQSGFQKVFILEKPFCCVFSEKGAILEASGREA